jgi:hypothetical protein
MKSPGKGLLPLAAANIRPTGPCQAREANSLRPLSPCGLNLTQPGRNRGGAARVHLGAGRGISTAVRMPSLLQAVGCFLPTPSRGVAGETTRDFCCKVPSKRCDLICFHSGGHVPACIGKPSLKSLQYRPRDTGLARSSLPTKGDGSGGTRRIATRARRRDLERQVGCNT